MYFHSVSGSGDQTWLTWVFYSEAHKTVVKVSARMFWDLGALL